MAVNQLHIHIMEKLQGIRELLAYENDEKLAQADELADAVVSSVTIDSLVIGTLEEAFFEMVCPNLHVQKNRWIILPKQESELSKNSFLCTMIKKDVN